MTMPASVAVPVIAGISIMHIPNPTRWIKRFAGVFHWLRERAGRTSATRTSELVSCTGTGMAVCCTE